MMVDYEVEGNRYENLHLISLKLKILERFSFNN